MNEDILGNESLQQTLREERQARKPRPSQGDHVNLPTMTDRYHN